jgi:glycosyltransferase involved in cell wall biosynthesis
MRILKVTQAYYPFEERGGPAVKVRSIARHLTQQGHKITVVTADLGISPEQVTAVGASRIPGGWRAEPGGVEAVYLTTRFHYRNLTVNPGIVSFCRRRLQEFDLVHIYGLYDLLGPTVARYCRRFKIPYFIEPLGMTRPIDRGFMLKKLWRSLVGDYMLQAAKIIGTSEIEKQELLAEGFAPARVLLRFNGIDREEFRRLPPPGTFRAQAGIPDGERLVLFLGRIIPRKGADLLIEAMPQFASDKIRLVIAGPEGETGYVQFLRDKARALGVESHVLFPGSLFGEGKKAAYVDATVFALPSRYENFGNVAAEAIACGTPAIVSDQCGIAPLIDQRAGLVTAYDAAGLGRTLKELLNNTELYNRLKAGCAQVADEISWDKLIAEMQNSYREAVL